MSKLHALAIATALFASHLCAEPLSALEGAITCELPKELVRIPESEYQHLQLKPLAAYRNKSRELVVTVTRAKHPHSMTIKDLPDVKQAMQTGMSRQFPDAAWKAQDIIVLNDRPWIHFELSTKTNGVQHRNVLLVTAYKGDQLQILLQLQNPLMENKLVEMFNLCSRTLRAKE